MTAWRGLLLASMLVLSGCATTLSEGQRAAVGRIIQADQPTALDCDAPDHCAQPSALMIQAAEDAPGQHRALILDHGQDALMVIETDQPVNEEIVRLIQSQPHIFKTIKLEV